jgi:hypothetical protein
MSQNVNVCNANFGSTKNKRSRFLNETFVEPTFKPVELYTSVNVCTIHGVWQRVEASQMKV